MTTWDNIEAAVFLVGCIDRRPGTHGSMRAKALAKVKLVLMPRETQTDLWRLSDKEIVDAEYIWSQQVD